MLNKAGETSTQKTLENPPTWHWWSRCGPKNAIDSRGSVKFTAKTPE